MSRCTNCGQYEAGDNLYCPGCEDWFRYKEEDEDMSEQPTLEKPKRGLAAMSPEDQHRIASMGGTAAWAQGKAHKFTSEEARAAGRKGGVRSGESRRRRREAAKAILPPILRMPENVGTDCED